MAYFTPDFIAFFREFTENNRKEWFDANRSRYEKSVKNPFQNFIAKVIEVLAQKDNSYEGVATKDCIFRINRDIRFSADKTPYKTQASALISPEGKKGYRGRGIYVEFSAEHVRFYGGVYEADKEQLMNIRANIASAPKQFATLYHSPEFRKTFGEIRGEKNKILPKEWKEVAEQEPLLYNKQFYFFAEHQPELLLTDHLLPELLHAYDVAQPITQFLNH